MMRFREATAEDIDLLRGISAKEFDKLHPPKKAETGFVWIDDDGTPRIAMVAEKVAEIYMVMDHEWATPAMRWSAIEQCHREMEARLRERGYNFAYSFFPDGVANGYIRRLIKMGWKRIIERCVRFGGVNGGT